MNDNYQKQNTMKIALAQINTTVGDFNSNTDKIISFAQKAKDKGAEICLFPEQCIPGYPAHDLLERSGFIDDNLAALEKIVQNVKGIAVVVGFAERNHLKIGKGLYNSAALIKNQKILSIHRKSLLPTYDVFDESRYFDPAESAEVTALNGKKIAITICEDIWNEEDFWRHRLYKFDPVKELIEQKAEIIFNIAASPFSQFTRNIRQEILSSLSKRYQIPTVLVNSIGGSDDLIFDGGSLVVNPQGIIQSRGREFVEDLVVTDTNSHNEENCDIEPLSDLEAKYKALVLGTSDYLRKCGFKKALVGLSGGIDSALVAVIGAEAVGKDNMKAVLMPSKYSSKGSITDSEKLAKNLGISHSKIPIEQILSTYLSDLEPILGDTYLGVTEENLQARIRGNILMAISNKKGNLLLTTGNKSELATGYCTLYGDMAGGLAVISDLSKSDVYKLSRYINRNKETIPREIIDKPPSAELRLDQVDTDSLPPYELLDKILEDNIVNKADNKDLINNGFDAELVARILRMVKLNEYKRRQAPPGLKVTSKAFGFGRRMPIAQRWDY